MVSFTESKQTSKVFKTSNKTACSFSSTNNSVPFIESNHSTNPANKANNHNSSKQPYHSRPSFNQPSQTEPFVEPNHNSSSTHNPAEVRIPFSEPYQQPKSLFNSATSLFGENTPRDDRDHKITKLTHDNLKKTQKIKALLKKNPDMEQFRVRNETEEHCYQRSIETLIFYNNSVPKKIKTGNCRMLFKSLTSLHKIAIQWGYSYQLRTFKQYLSKQGINYVEPKDAIRERREIVDFTIISFSPIPVSLNVVCR